MDIRTRLRDAVMAELDMSEDISDGELLEIIDSVIERECRNFNMPLSRREECRKRIFDSLRRLDVLQELVEDEDITEIMVNGMDAIYLEKEGRIYRWSRHFTSKDKLDDVIQKIVGRVNRQVNTSSPIVDARLENGARVNVVLPPVAINGPIMTIRKFPKSPLGMEDLIEAGSISAEAAEMLKNLVAAGYNIFISGGTGSGKTTFLNALSQYIPCSQRVITIEDSAELQLKETPNLVRLETRNSNIEGARQITIRDLIRTSLRMRPDRIIVGEVRGEEALDMLQAMNTGHSGSLCTGHANSPVDMFSRLETMVLMGAEIPIAAIRGQIASALDIVIHLGRMRDGSRKVMSIGEVTGIGRDGRIGWRALFESAPETGALQRRGRLKNRQKLECAGLSDIPSGGASDSNSDGFGDICSDTCGMAVLQKPDSGIDNVTPADTLGKGRFKAYEIKNAGAAFGTV